MTNRISSDAFAHQHPDRYSVFKSVRRITGGNWLVQRGTEDAHQFPTHAQAITYAQKIARQR